MKIWEPKPPGTLWATPGLLRESFTLLGFFTHVQRDGRLKLITDLYLVFKFRVHGALPPLVYMLLWQEYTNFLQIEGLPHTYSSQQSDMKQVHY